ncbi:hypothetical protein TRVL_06378 [Trypanosoma vivax]|nr:hypothetical protein TRVL_06378 [Trypanosoma vivax]
MGTLKAIRGTHKKKLLTSATTRCVKLELFPCRSPSSYFSSSSVSLCFKLSHHTLQEHRFRGPQRSNQVFQFAVEALTPKELYLDAPRHRRTQDDMKTVP